jgi:predicted secreted Zn-dependent protease
MQAPLSIGQDEHVASHRAALRPADDPGACTGQLRFAGPPAAVAAAVRSADPAIRGQLIGQLQRQVGNGSVSRLLARTRDPEAPGRMPLQRWAVTLPAATADCMVVVNWLDQHSPYRGKSGWALTSPTFGWGGDFSYSGSGKSLTVSVVHPTVSLSTSVDMPSWGPTDSGMKQAWATMSTELRAHEARHEEVASNWKATLLDRLKGLSLSIKSEGDGPAAVRKEWASWLVEHQADQTALDPFSALLDCSGGSSESADAGGGNQDGLELAAGNDGDTDASA